MKFSFTKTLPSIIITAIMTVPIIYVIGFAFSVDANVWQYLWKARIPKLMFTSFSLVFVVSIGTLIIGTVLALLTEKTNLPFKKILRPLLIAPLITPCYIIAICYVNFFGVKGLGEKVLFNLGLNVKLPNIYGFWGAAFVLMIGTYPYVYAIVSSSLKNLDRRYSEAARCLGARKIERFFTITVPLLIPAFTAGTILVSLYVLSDFGVVSLLRHSTFVSTIYEQMSGRYNYSTAASLSTILIMFTLMLFAFQELLQNKKQFVSSKSKFGQAPTYRLGYLMGPALVFIVLIIILGLLLPIGILMYWFVKSYSLSSEMSMWATSMPDLIKSGYQSVGLSVMAATLAVIFAIPIAHWVVREPNSKFAKSLSWMSQAGITLPGVLIALGLSLVFKNIAPKLNFSVLALLLAFLVHFFAQSFQMTKAGLTQISNQLEESSRMLGYNARDTFWLVTRPLVKPALFTAWILVFLSCMRELPASLLLRPAGFDPLTVQVWNAASEGFYELAAAPALLIIFLSLPLVIIITKSRGKLLAT